MLLRKKKKDTGSWEEALEFDLMITRDYAEIRNQRGPGRSKSRWWREQI